ncbi:hypothetical protein [Catenuloplanes japonicus]|uniref:hypothetical protein n=1 Tax=Catenuloplanes japonicus TaxID=33876 RepID=UPI000525F305|nr:hypothetical protein [Catenuloplanes japonicus]
MFRRRALPLLAAAVFAVPALSGCILVSTENPEPAAPPATTAAPTPASAASAVPTPTGLPKSLPTLPSLPGGAKNTGDSIGDPCELLNRAEVIALTARQISQIDKDGLDKTAATRYCQWQLSEGQLAIFVTGTTAADFKIQAKAGDAVAGVGDSAFTQSGHLFVLAGDTQLDVYARVGDDAQNLRVAKMVADRVIPRL